MRATLYQAGIVFLCTAIIVEAILDASAGRQAREAGGVYQGASIDGGKWMLSDGGTVDDYYAELRARRRYMDNLRPMVGDGVTCDIVCWVPIDAGQVTVRPSP